MLPSSAPHTGRPLARVVARWHRRRGGTVALVAVAAVLAGALAAPPRSAGAQVSEPSSATGGRSEPSAALSTGTPTAGMAGYRLSDAFGEVPGVTQVDPVGVADDGTVAGNYVFQGQSRGFRARPGQPFEELYAADATRIEIDAVAPNGIIAGHIATIGAADADGWTGSWTPDEEGNLGEFRRLLSSPSGATFRPEVRDVNSRGDVLLQHAVLHPDGSQTLLAHPRPGGTNPEVWANDIDEAGRVVGHANWVEFNAEVHRAVMWTGGAPMILNVFGDVTARADAIGGDGTIAIQAQTGTPEQGLRTYLVDLATSRRDPVGDPGTHVLIQDINATGTAVGNLATSSGAVAPVAVEGGVLRRLDPLVDTDADVHLQTATAINADGVITGDADWQGHASAYVARPVSPVVFVHGAGASRISQIASTPTPDRGDEGAQQWMKCGEDRRHLSLWPADLADGTAMADLAAFAPLRDERCYIFGSWADSALGVYDDLLSHIEHQGFAPYRVDGRLARYTTDGCDTEQSGANLFTFAYDWRKDNAQSAQRLADFMGCVQRIWPDRKVNVVTHSMGSLVAQRYLLDVGAAAPVDRLVTFGAPWLGSPKTVNVLYTGEFAPRMVNGPTDVIRHIVGSFTAAHQLMAGPQYGQLATQPVLMEAGVDLNGDGIDRQIHPFDRYASMLDAGNPTFRPGETARAWHMFPNQSDWSGSRTDVDLTHFVGLQAGRNTIGTTTARSRVVCDVLGTWNCSSKDVFEQDLICGDGTVPLVSATRVGRGRDLNAPDAEIRVLQSPSTGRNATAEHTGITANADALARLDELLTTPSSKDLPGGYVGPVGGDDQDLGSCTGATTPSGLAANDSTARGSTANRTAVTATQRTPDQAHSLRYVRLLGGTDLAVSDDQRHHTPAADGSTGEVPGVTQFGSGRDDASLTTLPISSERTYRLDFTATGDPLQLEVLDGTQQAPSRAMRWSDLDVAEGPVELEMRPDRTPVLRIDDDGDGELDTTIAPTVEVTGAAAADVTAPELNVTAIGSGASRRYAVSATDDGSGVADVKVSTGGRFSTYDGPFNAPNGTTSIRVFATDAAGNRSPMQRVALADVATTPLTTATRTPAANAHGWNTGPVTVDLVAESTDGVAAITWRAEGATSAPAATVAGDRATATITAPGVTHLRFRATASDGTVEPERTLVVRIDDDEPAAQILAPFADSTTSELKELSGTATDAISGIAKVEVQIWDRNGRSWDGNDWTGPEDPSPSDDDTAGAWLPAASRSATSGTATWTRRSGNPAGDDLPQGAYRLRVRVTDGAGHRTTTPLARITVSSDAAWKVTELRTDRPASQTSARRVTDRGVVLGGASNAGTAQTLLWSGGNARELPLPSGATVEDLAIDASRIGSVPVAGSSARRATTWRSDGTSAELATPAGASGATAVATGGPVGAPATRVVGTATTAGAPGHGDTIDGVIWDQDGPHRLAVPTAGWLSRPTDVNRSGAAVGWYESANIFDGTPDRALLWAPDGAVRHLGTLGAPDRASSRATAVNDLGVAVGSAWTDVEIAGEQHAVAFVDGEVRTVDGGLFTERAEAVDVNDRGWIVGNYTDHSKQPRAFLSIDGQSAVDLNTLLPQGSEWVIQRATAINELGQVVGFGTVGGVARGFVLSSMHAPVAEDVTATAAGSTLIQLDGWDPDVDDKLTYEMVDRPTHGAADLLDGGSLRYRPTAGYTGRDSLSYRVSDGRFTSAVGRVSITVTEPGGPTEPQNRAPTAAIAGPSSGDEGTTVTFDASGSTDPDGDVLTYAWDLDADGEFDDGDQASADLDLVDDGERPVVLRVTDPGGAADTVAATIVVRNAVPVMRGLPATASVTAGTALQLSGTVTDVGADTHTATLDPGDGSAAIPLTVANGAFTLRHTYTEAGVRTMTLTVVDDDGGRAMATVTVTVTAAARTLAPATITLAGSAAVAGTGSGNGSGKADQIGLVGIVKASTSSTTGVIGIARTGRSPMALGSVKVTRAGTYTEGGVRYGVVIGTGVLGSGRSAKAVTYELTVADGSPDKVWLSVKDNSGTIVEGLTVGGTAPAGGLSFSVGSASVTPR